MARRREPWSESEWRDFAVRLREIAKDLSEMASEVSGTLTIRESTPIWDLPEKVRHSIGKIENAVCRQIGDDAGMRALHGPDSHPPYP